MSKNIIKLLKKENNAIMPNVKDKIKARLSFKKSKSSYKKPLFFGGISFAAVCLVLIIALPLLISTKGNQGSETVVTFDINPKFVFTLNDDNSIKDVSPLNLEGIFIVNEVKPLIVNKTLEYAIDISLKELDDNGFLIDNPVKVLAACKDSTKEVSINNEIMTNIKNFKPLKTEKINIVNIYSIDKKPKAEKFKVSLGFYTLAEDLAIKSKQPINKTIKKSLNDIMNELYDVNVIKFNEIENKIDYCLEDIKRMFNEKKDEYKNTLEFLENDVEILLDLLDDGKDYVEQLSAFKAKYPDFVGDKNLEKDLEKYFNIKEKDIEKQIDELEKRYKQEKNNIYQNIKDKNDDEIISEDIIYGDFDDDEDDFDDGDDLEEDKEDNDDGDDLEEDKEDNDDGDDIEEDKDKKDEEKELRVDKNVK